MYTISVVCIYTSYNQQCRYQEDPVNRMFYSSEKYTRFLDFRILQVPVLYTSRALGPRAYCRPTEAGEAGLIRMIVPDVLTIDRIPTVVQSKGLSLGPIVYALLRCLREKETHLGLSQGWLPSVRFVTSHVMAHVNIHT